MIKNGAIPSQIVLDRGFPQFYKDDVLERQLHENSFKYCLFNSKELSELLNNDGVEDKKGVDGSGINEACL